MLSLLLLATAAAPTMAPKQCYSDGTTLSEDNPRVIVKKVVANRYIYFYYIPKGLIPIEKSIPTWMLENWYPVKVECPWKIR